MLSTKAILMYVTEEKCTTAPSKQGPNVRFGCCFFNPFFEFLSAAVCKNRIKKTSIPTNLDNSYFVRAFNRVSIW